jgi:thiol-disulfide isomerase/thioredoxin
MYIKKRMKKKTCMPMDTTKLIIIIIIAITLSFVLLYVLQMNKIFEGFTSDMNVEYYSKTGCGHCNTFNPTWDTFVKENPNIKCTKYIDDKALQRADDVEYTLNGFPSIVKCKNNKFDSEYTGDRSKEDLLKFYNM